MQHRLLIAIFGDDRAAQAASADCQGAGVPLGDVHTPGNESPAESLWDWLLRSGVDARRLERLRHAGRHKTPVVLRVAEANAAVARDCLGRHRPLLLEDLGSDFGSSEHDLHHPETEEGR